MGTSTRSALRADAAREGIRPVALQRVVRVVPVAAGAAQRPAGGEDPRTRHPPRLDRVAPALPRQRLRRDARDLRRWTTCSDEST